MPRKSLENSRPNLLIVEDELFLSELVMQKLKKSGFNVQEALDGETALKLAEKHPPDAILLDILLPGIDGFEVLRRVKQDGRLKRIPVIVFSNLGEAKDIEKAMSGGASEYLIKAETSVQKIADTIGKYVMTAK